MGFLEGLLASIAVKLATKLADFLLKLALEGIDKLTKRSKLKKGIEHARETGDTSDIENVLRNP